MAGGYGCDGGALRWLSVVLQIGRGREPERAEGGIAVGDDSVASLEGPGRKQEVARGERARRHASAYWQRLRTTASASGLGQLEELGQVGCQVSQVGLSLSLFFYLFLFLLS